MVMMGANYQLLEHIESPRGHEAVSGPSDSEQSASGVLRRLCVQHRAYRDLLGDLQDLTLPAGVTLDDVLDAVVGLSVGHAVAGSKAPFRQIPE
jgi:hypothetical protein